MTIYFATSAESVGQLFSDGKTYRMPEFQRPYSWPDDRALQLFEDLQAASVNSGKHLAAKGGVEYFLGALIVTQQSARSPYLIIDGQQRLVTLLTILALLRDHLPKGPFRQSLQERIERPEDQAANFGTKPRVELRDLDQDVFSRLVITDGGTNHLPDVADSKSTARLLDAIKQLKVEFPRATNEFIQSLATFILNNCSFVVITANSIDDAYRLFKSVNNPGLPLSDLALARTELLGPHAHDQALCAQIAEAWDAIEEQIGEDELRGYIATLAALILPGATERSLFEVIREISRSNRLAIDFYEKLRSFLLAYRGLEDATIDFGADTARINRHIACILNAPFDHWRTAALFWLTRGKGNRESLDFFRGLDGLCLGLQISGYKSKTIAQRFASVVAAIANNSVLSRTTSPLYLTDSERAAIREKINGPLKKTGFTKNLLLRLNVAVGDASIPPFFPKDVEIEHVMPQRPSANSPWAVQFPDADKREQLLHLLGNLALLTSRINKAASNAPFTVKREKVFSLNQNNCFALTANIAAHSEWTPDVILKRQRGLVRHASEIMGL